MPFVSCEDDMIHHLGVFNIACTITSLITMVVPFHYLSHSISLASSVSTLEQTQQQRIKPITRGLILHSVTILMLFLFNWYEHMTGYSGPPSIQTFGVVSSNMLAALLYNLWWMKMKRENITKDSIQGQNESSPLLLSSSLAAPLPQTITFLLTTLSIMCVSIGFVLDAHWEKVMVQDVISPFISIYTISTMGRLSYLYDEKNHDHQHKQKGYEENYNATVNSPVFHSWKMACISFGIMMPGIELESSFCHLFDNDSLQMVISRFYHSIFLHIIIPLTFFFVSKCACQLVEMELKLSNNRNYESKKVK